jgi:SAM-dependent methyltransferase
MTEAELRERMAKYTFYHTIQLTDRIATPGWKVVEPLCDMTLRNLRTLDLKGKRVLDIGCRDGLFCLEAEKLGAREVIGIDNDPSIGAREFLIPFFRSSVQLHELNVLDLTPQTFGKFDVVLFPGVLYHLRYPFWALKLIRDVLEDDGKLVLETAVFVDDNQFPLLFCPIGAESPYEPTSCTFFNTKGLMDTLYSLGLTVQHIEYLNPHTHSKKALGSQQATPLIDRATLVCQMTPQVLDASVSNYWNDSHRIHTRYQGAISAAASSERKAHLQTK